MKLNRKVKGTAMKPNLTMKHLFAVMLAPWILNAALAVENAPIQHKFLVNDYWTGKIHYVNQSDLSQSWSEPWGGKSADLQLIGNNRLLVSKSDGWAVYDLTTRAKVDEVKLTGIVGISTVRRLPDGRTFVGVTEKIDGKEAVAVVELDAANHVIRKTTFPQFHTLHFMRRTPQDAWLLSVFRSAVEVSLAAGLADDKRVLHEYKLPRGAKAHMAVRKPDGNVLLAGGYAAALFEYKPDGKRLREFVAKQPDGMRNRSYSALQLLPNGHIIEANWNGHGPKEYTPGWKLIEFDSEGKVVWHWNESPEKVGGINAVIVMDCLDLALLHDDVTGVLAPVKK